MNKLSIPSVVLVAALIGCGGKNHQGASEPAPAAMAMERTESAQPRNQAPAEPGTAEPGTPTQGSAKEIPTNQPQANGGKPAVPAPGTTVTPGIGGSGQPGMTGNPPGMTGNPSGPPTEGVRAEAEIKLLKTGASVGTIGFVELGGSVVMTARLAGLPAGPHGFHIHEKGDCGGKHAVNAGGHFNPTGAKHGPPESSMRHAGDLGNLTVDKDGNATFEMSTDSMTVKAGADSVIGRAIVIHARKDDGKTQPSGASGDPIACGVIRKLEGQSVSVIVE
jgi:superoxide dismutase, Cu-Zn family